ncbi:MAG: hypothetical protein K2I94_00680 [Muribaculaceae bacterium]|nr:hypothetical protein [Muribaculaceae bacterium]
MSEEDIKNDNPEVNDEQPAEKIHPADRHACPRGKLHSFNWLGDVPGQHADDDIVEVLFKNTRKGYYRNSTNIPLEIGDLVAVEASPGHDIGKVSLVGKLVRLQMKKAGVKNETEIKRVFRKARPNDIEKFEEAKARENDTMIRSRKIAESLNLNMKIGDVEYQGDGCKAIFYYIADERVDFRQLIKILADTFKIRVEMKQIGSRQEAGRIGGIGPCGRPLCCASWMTNFVSVATSAARYQDISLNPQKLAGQCAKLKCCLNFEADAYVECVKQLPSREIRLETADATYYHFKTDIFKKELTYSTDKSMPANLVTISADRAFEIIAMNKRGEKPMSLVHDDKETEKPGTQYNDILGQDITRFDKKKKKKKKNHHQNRTEADGSASERSEDDQNNRRRNNDRRDRYRNKGDQQPRQNQNDNSTNESED